MILSFTYQCRLFFLTIVLGLLSALIYHILYEFYRAVGLKGIIKGILDIIYWLIFSITLFLIMLKLNSGEVRPFAIFGSSMGMVLYYTLFKPFAHKLIYPFFCLVKRLLLLIFTIIATPIRLILYPINKILHRILLFFKKHLKKYGKYEKITLSKLKGVEGLPAAVKKKYSKFHICWTIMMIVTICIFVAALCYQYLVHLQLNTAKQEIEVQIAEAKAESAALTKQYENQDSPEFIEKIAREKLNMVYPSELVFINSNSDEGKKLLNSIKRSSARLSSVKENANDIDNDVSTRVE